MKLVYQFFTHFKSNFHPLGVVSRYRDPQLQVGENHSFLHPLQVEKGDSNSRLVVDEDDYGKFRLERV